MQTGQTDALSRVLLGAAVAQPLAVVLHLPSMLQRISTSDQPGAFTLQRTLTLWQLLAELFHVP
jgi:hypothetical protein